MALSSSRKNTTKKTRSTSTSTAASKTKNEPRAATRPSQRRYAEAPDRGYYLSEPPEEPRAPREEAPDWGDSVVPEQSTFHNCS